jgi:shikimate kinase
VIVLIGPPGAGKTTVGQALATLTGLPFVDTDQMVEEAAGTSVAQIFITQGEDAFRAMEREAVAQALSRGIGIVGLGGGAPMDPATRDLLKGHEVVFLDVSDAVAVRRVGLDASRPLLVGSPRAQWRALMAERRPIYTQAATLTLVNDAAPPADIAADVVRLLEKRREDPDG